ncbi:hypothetical protein [Alteromonas gracilis]|uniref:hypothetical protein n=1 Tax=Alteromonas gracilis TaxID=1479524 RepID=UPI0030CF6D8E
MDLKQIDLILDNNLLAYLSDHAKDDLMETLLASNEIKLPEELDGLCVEAIHNLDPRELGLHTWRFAMESEVDKNRPYIHFLGDFYVS